MIRGQAANIADFLATKGYTCTIGVVSPDPETVNYSVTAQFNSAGGPALTGLQQLMAEAASRGLVARVNLTVLVTDA